jgi:hypothetical protein
VDMSILDGLIFIAILVGIVLLIIVDWREAIEFLILMGLGIFIVYSAYQWYNGVCRSGGPTGLSHPSAALTPPRSK